MHKKFMGTHQPAELQGKTVILIDDGMATGNTILATINVLKKSNPAKIIVAVPVATETAIEKISSEADEVITLVVPEFFFGVGSFYDEFDDVSDEEVKYYLDKIRELKKAG
jgi:predicted phosphoribosyltransferase